MKTRQLFMLLGGVILCSCSDNDIPGESGDSSNNNQPELTAPVGFDWTTSKNVQIDLKSTVPTTVSVYADRDCKEENILVENLYINESVSMKCNVPIGNEEVYVQYKNASGEKKVMPYSVDSGLSKASDDVTMPEDVYPTSESDAGFTFYHNTGVAMFEDAWPSKGDYDFNDVVMEYDMKVTECNDPALYASQGYKENLMITMDIRAIGGGYARVMGLILEGLDKKYVDPNNSSMVIQKKYGQGREEDVAQSEGYKTDIDMYSDNIMLTFDGMVKVGNYGNGGKFYQVTPGYIETGTTNPDHYMIRVKFILAPNLSINREERLQAFRDFILDTKNQNFFIGVYDNSPTNTEVHPSGYKPSYKYAEAYNGKSADMDSAIPYRGKDGTVWGIKVPVGTRHAYEGRPFKQAYPKFKAWIESDGTSNRDWYLFPQSEDVVKYW